MESRAQAGDYDFPQHWGSQPILQTTDWVLLPRDYGFGTSTLATWIEEKMAEDDCAELYPAHWGCPPVLQTMDWIELPGDYGFGSSTLATWIEEKMAEDDCAELYPAHWGCPP